MTTRFTIDYLLALGFLNARLMVREPLFDLLLQKGGLAFEIISRRAKDAPAQPSASPTVKKRR